MKRDASPCQQEGKKSHQEKKGMSIYKVTNHIPLGASGIATLLAAKNSLCVARNDAQLALYDTTDFSKHTIVETSMQEYTCRRGFARDFHIRQDEKTLARFSEDEGGIILQRWKQNLQNNVSGALKRATHSHDDMQPTAMTSNDFGNIVCMAKTIDDCSALEIHTISGKTANELTLKKTIPCDGYFAITDLAYTPNQTCVSIAHDAIKEWDALTGKAIRIGAYGVPKAKLDFSNQSDEDIEPSRTVMLGSSVFAPVIGFVLAAESPPKEKLESRILEAPFGDRGRLLPIGRNILVSAHYHKHSLHQNYVGMLDMRAKRMLCHPMEMEAWHVYDMAQSPSENCFLTGGDEKYEVYWNMVKEWDWRKIGSPMNSKDKPKPVRTFDTEVEWKNFKTIRTLANHKNNILAIVTQQSEVQENGTFLRIWDSTKYKAPTPGSYGARPNNYPTQTIKISDSIEPSVHMSVLKDDRVLVVDSQGLTELTLASS